VPCGREGFRRDGIRPGEAIRHAGRRYEVVGTAPATRLFMISRASIAALVGGLTVLSSRAGDAALADIPFERYRLPNGLDVVLHVDRRAPIADIEVWYKVGSRDEGPGKTGFAHLFEHMMFEGSKHIPKGGYFAYLSEAGASARNGSTTPDTTSYFETLPASQLELGLWLESSRMGFLLDRPNLGEAFANQREVVRNERRQTVENVPLGGIERFELEALYPEGHPYRHEVIGSMHDLQAASAGDLTHFFNRFYAPNNAVLLVAGDIDTAAAKQLIARYFGPITAGPPVSPPSAANAPAPKAERRVVMEANIKLAQGRMAWTTVPVFAPGDAEMDMLATIVAGGKSSRLYRRLVDELGLAQSVSAVHGSRALGGIFEIEYTAMPGHGLAEIEKAIDEELDLQRTQPPSSAEVERARNQLEADAIRSIDPLRGAATRLLYYDVFAGDPGYLRPDLDRYDRATPATLLAWAKRLLTNTARVVIDVQPYVRAPVMGRLALPVTFDSAFASPRHPTTGASTLTEPLRTTPDAPFRWQRPLPGSARPYAIPLVQRFHLKNGLPVILAESHELPLVNIDLTIKTGSSANPPGQAGLANLVADMLDEGTRHWKAAQVATQIAQLGASLVTEVSWDSSTVSVSLLRKDLDHVLPIWSDVVLHPSFAEQDRKRVVDKWLSTLALRKDDPAIVASHVYARVLWGDRHPFAWPQSGTVESLRKIQREDLQSFYRAYYVPNNAVLTVTGDVTEQEVRSKLDALFAGWRARKIPSAPWTVAGTEPAKTRIVLVDKPGAAQSSIRIGLPAIDRKSRDYYRALLTNQILGGTFGRLAMSLREDKGWTYDVSSEFDVRRDQGPWTVSAEVEADHTADAVREILQQVERLRDGAVSERELARAKDELIGAFPARFATAEDLGDQLTELSLYDLPAHELDRFVQRIEAIGPTAIRGTAHRYLRPEQLLIVVVGNRASHETALQAISAIEQRDADGNLVREAKRNHAGSPATQPHQPGATHG
jgi:zinc protease